MDNRTVILILIITEVIITSVIRSRSMFHIKKKYEYSKLHLLLLMSSSRVISSDSNGDDNIFPHKTCFTLHA